MLGKQRMREGNSFLCLFCHLYFCTVSGFTVFFSREKASILKLEVNRDVNVDTTVSPSNSIDL